MGSVFQAHMRAKAFRDHLVAASLKQADPREPSFLSFRATTEVMCVHDLAVLHVRTFAISNLVSNELVKPSNADAGLPLMGVVIIVADVKKEVTVIKHADPGKFVVRHRRLV
jgi:hypothetical protein